MPPDAQISIQPDGFAALNAAQDGIATCSSKTAIRQREIRRVSERLSDMDWILSSGNSGTDDWTTIKSGRNQEKLLSKEAAYPAVSTGNALELEHVSAASRESRLKDVRLETKMHTFALTNRLSVDKRSSMLPQSNNRHRSGHEYQGKP